MHKITTALFKLSLLPAFAVALSMGCEGCETQAPATDAGPGDVNSVPDGGSNIIEFPDGGRFVIGPDGGLTPAPKDAGSTATDTDGGQIVVGPDGGQFIVGPDGGLIPVPPTDDAGSTEPSDAGDPLIQPIDDFCAGQGAVVSVGESGEAGTCSGELATETFRYAMCACDTINVQNGQLTVDAFNSNLGSYGAAIDGGVNINDDGQVGVNAGMTLNKKITIGGSVFVGNGDFSAGSSSDIGGNLMVNGDALGSNISVGRNAFINGNIGDYEVSGDLLQPVGATSNATVGGATLERNIPGFQPCACDANDLLDIGGLTSWSATHNDNALLQDPLSADAYATDNGNDLRLPCGRYYLSSVSQGNTMNIVAEGRVALFVDGDFQTGGLTISVEDGAEIDLFVKGSFGVSSAASIGSSDRPAAVRTYIGGVTSLQASASIGGNLYAPLADVTFSASSKIYGSVFVNSATFEAAATIHFDSAVRTLAANCVPPELDAGVLPDGGIADAGNPNPKDGGPVPPTDGGTPPDPDAGNTGTPDAGAPPPVDAGMSIPPDAGMSVPDAGPPAPECSDICSSECGALSCLLDGNGSGGVCGLCQSDLDCCAPALCFTGTCLFIGG